MLERLLAVSLAATAVGCSFHLEQHDMPASRRASYNNAFFWRHNYAYRFSGAIHFAHARQHDVLVFTDASDAAKSDAEFEAESLEWLRNPPAIEPSMFDYGPHTGQAAWKLYQAIDWTHVHHEQTYEILSDADIAWPKKGDVTAEAVEYYLNKLDNARSPAPLEVTMRRAGVMMKPYFGGYRTQWPRSATFFYVAHWWHPAIYEAMMIAGNGAEQDAVVREVHGLTSKVLQDRPTRMLLSREIMPRYSRMSPESANIFDNLHMLHGIAYAILAYPKWSIDEKRAELYRVLDAMSEKPGDRALARTFTIEHPDMDPRRYEPWMKGYEGPMNRIMEQMLAEMWPMMSPDGGKEIPKEVLEQFRMKLAPGLSPGEHPGSVHDALMKVAPGMKMDPEAMKPGVTPKKMVDAMLAGWREKAEGISPVEPLPMATAPSPPSR